MAGMFYEIIPGYGYCLTVDDAHNTIRVYQEQTRNRYSATIKTPQFGSIDVRSRPRKIHWEDDQKGKVTRECLLYDGVPFHILGKKVFYCEFGRDRNPKILKDEDGNLIPKQRSTKKVNCPALIYVKEVMKYPDYMINENSATARNQMADRLRSDICEQRARGERRFYIVFPNVKEHQNHAVFFDGKLMLPHDIPCQDDEVTCNDAPVKSKTNNADLCRELIEDLQNLLRSNSDDSMLLSQAETALNDALDLFSSDPPISVLLSR